MWAKEGYCDSNKAHMQVPAPRCPSPPLPTIDLSAVRLAVRGARGTTPSHISRGLSCAPSVPTRRRPDSSQVQCPASCGICQALEDFYKTERTLIAAKDEL